MKLVKKAMSYFVLLYILNILGGCGIFFKKKGSSSHGGESTTDLEDDSSQNSDNATPEKSETGDSTTADGESERYLRTGTEYIAAIAKTLGLTKSEVAKAAHFEERQSSLALSSVIDKKNVNDGYYVSSIAIAADACSYFLAKEENKDLDAEAVLNQINLQLFPMPSDATELTRSVNTIVDLVDDENEKVLLSCALAVSAGNMMY